MLKPPFSRQSFTHQRVPIFITIITRSHIDILMIKIISDLPYVNKGYPGGGIADFLPMLLLSLGVIICSLHHKNKVAKV